MTQRLLFASQREIIHDLGDWTKKSWRFPDGRYVYYFIVTDTSPPPGYVKATKAAFRLNGVPAEAWWSPEAFAGIWSRSQFDPAKTTVTEIARHPILVTFEPAPPQTVHDKLAAQASPLPILPPIGVIHGRGNADLSVSQVLEVDQIRIQLKAKSDDINVAAAVEIGKLQREAEARIKEIHASVRTYSMVTADIDAVYESALVAARQKYGRAEGLARQESWKIVTAKPNSKSAARKANDSFTAAKQAAETVMSAEIAVAKVAWRKQRIDCAVEYGKPFPVLKL